MARKYVANKLKHSMDPVSEVAATADATAEQPIKTNAVQDAISTVDVSKYNINVFDELYAKIRGIIANKEFNAGNWISLVTLSMEMVETLPHLTGRQKRDLVVDLVTKLVGEIPMAENQRATVQAILGTALPAIIDVICDSSLGVYAINLIDQAQEKCHGCFASKCPAKVTAKSKAQGARRHRR
jgi:hypothetical protein